jgi:hypothetical protein
VILRRSLLSSVRNQTVSKDLLEMISFFIVCVL